MATTGDKFAERTRSKARNIGMRTDRVQQLYVKERVLYRLNEAFQGLMLKGGTVDYIRSPATARFSPDLDLHLPERPDDFDILVADILGRPYYDEHGVVDDGLEVRAVRCQDLHVGDEPGVKMRLECWLGRTRVNLKIDFAFGGPDPDPLEVRSYPCMFPGVPGFLVRTQPVAYKIADKLHAMVEHGAGNTRVKDVWDIAWHMSRGTVTHDELARAISHTFWSRGTEIDPAPAGLTAAWSVANERAWAKWHAAVGMQQDRTLVETVEMIRQPVLRALVRARSLQSRREPHLHLVPSAA